MHNVRLMRLKTAAPGLIEGLSKAEDPNALKKKLLKDALIKSGKAIENPFKKAAKEGKIKGFNLHPTAFPGYLLAQEAHHPRTNYYLSQTKWPYGGPKNTIWNLGMGKNVKNKIKKTNVVYL